jgi:parallel beta-helix repeat protein
MWRWSIPKLFIVVALLNLAVSHPAESQYRHPPSSLIYYRSGTYTLSAPLRLSSGMIIDCELAKGASGVTFIITSEWAVEADGNGPVKRAEVNNCSFELRTPSSKGAFNLGSISDSRFSNVSVSIGEGVSATPFRFACDTVPSENCGGNYVIHPTVTFSEPQEASIAFRWEGDSRADSVVGATIENAGSPFEIDNSNQAGIFGMVVQNSLSCGAIGLEGNVNLATIAGVHCSRAPIVIGPSAVNNQLMLEPESVVEDLSAGQNSIYPVPPSKGDELPWLDARLRNGGTVIIPRGRHIRHGALFIQPRQPLTLVGEDNTSELFFEGESGVSTAVTIARASDVTIENLRLTGSRNPPSVARMISIIDSSRITLRSLTISGASRAGSGWPIAGIVITRSSDVLVEGNTLAENGPVDGYPQGFDIVSIWTALPYVSGVTIRNNKIFSFRTIGGIGLDAAEQSEVSSNLIYQNNVLDDRNPACCGYGIFTYRSAPAPVRSHDINIAKNVVLNSAGTGIYVLGSDNVLVEDNEVLGAARRQNDSQLAAGAFGVGASSAVTLRNNRAYYTPLSGVSIAVTTDPIVEGNWIAGFFKFGIHIRGTNVARAVVQQNHIHAGWLSLEGDLLSNATVANNEFFATRVAPVHIKAYSQLSFTNNYVGWSTTGAQFLAGSGAIIVGNRVDAIPGGTGILLRGTVDNLSNNSTADCQIGILIDGAAVLNDANNLSTCPIPELKR